MAADRDAARRPGTGSGLQASSSAPILRPARTSRAVLLGAHWGHNSTEHGVDRLPVRSSESAPLPNPRPGLKITDLAQCPRLAVLGGRPGHAAASRARARAAGQPGAGRRPYPSRFIAPPVQSGLGPCQRDAAAPRSWCGSSSRRRRSARTVHPAGRPGRAPQARPPAVLIGLSEAAQVLHRPESKTDLESWGLSDLKRRLAVTRVQGALYMCPHEACPLSTELLTGTTLMCHGSRFGDTSGVVLRGPAARRWPCIVREQGGEIQVAVCRASRTWTDKTKPTRSTPSRGRLRTASPAGRWPGPSWPRWC